MEGTFVLNPHPPGISEIFSTWFSTPGKNISVKNAIAVYFDVKYNNTLFLR